MTEEQPIRFRSTRDLPSAHLLGTGTPTCAGCGGMEALHQMADVLGNKTVFVNAAGCMTLLAVYPFTPFRGGWLYTAMASAPAGAQGVRDALDILRAKGRLPDEEDMEVVVLTGDGAAYGIGSHGYPGFKKDLFAIWAANKPAYVATIIGAEPLDLAKKVEKLQSMKGPRLLISLAPCPTGWDFDPRHTAEIGRLAVSTGIWPLKEYVDGEVVHTKVPRERRPVEEYLQLQGRFKHLFEPQRDAATIAQIQSRVDAYWAAVE